MVSQESEDTSRLRILKAAEAEFAEKGFDGARVDAIAGRAGVNKALLYYYFKSKAGLLDALFEDYFAELKAAQNAHPRPDPTGDWDTYLRAIIGTALEVTRRRIDLMRVLVLEELKGGDTNTRVIRLWRQQWEAALEEARQAGADLPYSDQAVHDFFFSDLPMVLFLLLGEKWSAAMGLDPAATEASFHHLIRLHGDAYWRAHQKKE